VRRYLDVREGTPCEVDGTDLSISDMEAIARSPRFRIVRSLNGRGFEVSSRGWIGQIPITRDLTIRVNPKVPVGNIFWMLDVARQFSTFELWDHYLEALEAIPDLFERLASMLAVRVHNRLRKGLYREYRACRDELSVVRGRIDTIATIVGSTVRSRVVCEYDEHTPDILHNQIPLFALHLISKLALSDESIMQTVRRAHRAMRGAVSLVPVSGIDFSRVSYGRLDDDYRPIHVLSRFFIDHVGPSIGGGDSSMLPFTIEMPHLFESFVAEWLRIALHPRWRVTAKHALRIQSNSQLTYSVDLIIQDNTSSDGRIVAVLDTKYKDADLPSTDDINQVVTYAVESGTSRAFLIYPRLLSRPFTAKIGSITVESLYIDLSARPRPDGSALLARLKQCFE
jgi:5-methylcytosine-specific restriction enzyme subunit McrC